MEVKKTKTVEITERYTFTTDDIEHIIKEYLGLNDMINVQSGFRWDIGQWVSLSVTVKRKEDSTE